MKRTRTGKTMWRFAKSSLHFTSVSGRTVSSVKAENLVYKVFDVMKPKLTNVLFSIFSKNNQS